MVRTSVKGSWKCLSCSCGMLNSYRDAVIMWLFHNSALISFMTIYVCFLNNSWGLNCCAESFCLRVWLLNAEVHQHYQRIQNTQQRSKPVSKGCAKQDWDPEELFELFTKEWAEQCKWVLIIQWTHQSIHWQNIRWSFVKTMHYATSWLQHDMKQTVDYIRTCVIYIKHLFHVFHGLMAKAKGSHKGVTATKTITYQT
jgi:hypothetical protein